MIITEASNHVCHSCSPYLFAEERVEGAEQEGDTCREGYKGIHVGTAMNQLLPGCHVELPAAVDQVQQRDDEHRLVGRIARTYPEPAHRDSHHQQGEQPRDGYLVPQRGIGSALDSLHIAVFLDHHVVAYLAQFVLHLLQSDPLRVIFHQRRTGRQIDGNRLDAVERIEFLLDAGRAASAHHAEYGNCLLFHFWVQR